MTLYGMVLAAGFGTRLRPLTETTPKALIPVAGRPMIHYALDWLKSGGITEAAINSHHAAEKLESALGDGSALGLIIHWSREAEILGTGGGVGKMSRVLPRGRAALINCDSLIDADLNEAVRFHEKMGAAATLVTVPEKQPGVFTSVWADDANRVICFGEKTGAGLRPTTYVGAAILEPALLDYLPSNRFAGLVADGLVPALRDGLIVAAFPHPGYFIGLDSRERIDKAEADIANGLFPRDKGRHST